MHAAMVAARETEVQKQDEADAARDATVAAEWAFHNQILGAKDQVRAQYGDNSNEYAATGLTKKSERHSHARAKAMSSFQSSGLGMRVREKHRLPQSDFRIAKQEICGQVRSEVGAREQGGKFTPMCALTIIARSVRAY